jgi:PAS domain S-box-containing protein
LPEETGTRKAVEGAAVEFKDGLETQARVPERRNRAEQMVSDAEYFTDDSGDAVFDLSLDCRVTAWNLAAARTFGYRSEEVLGRSISELALGRLCSEAPRIVERLSLGEPIDPFEFTRVLDTGELIVLYLNVSPRTTPAGAVEGASLTVRHGRRRKRPEDVFRLAVDAAPTAMVMVDGSGIIVLVNAQTEKLFGYRREELQDQPFDILVPQKYRDSHPANRLGFMDGPSTRPMGADRDLYGLRKDGSEFPIEIGLNPVETDHGTWVLSSIMDITERKRAREEIQRLNHDLENRVAARTTELTAANVELEAFSYSVAHDLRAPLRQIAGFSRILTETVGSELDPVSRRYLQKVEEGAHQMGCLIDDLLNLASVSRRVISRRSTPLNDLIDLAIEELSPDSLNREIEWQIEDLWSVQCDPGLVKQVFVNLLSNAIKYTRVRTRAVIHIGQTSLSGERVIFVRDNGVGFDMAYSGKLFGVFQRLHKAADFEGTGVGLATAQRIIHKHGGRIWADAKLDKGATFSFTIPDAPGSPPK